MRYLIPNTITCLSLVCGFAAILMSAEGQMSQAVNYIMIGAFLDMLDGYAARRLRATSRFGQQLDSLADVVVFGAAPAVILYQHFYVEAGLIGAAISSLPMIGAALRLARFNLTEKTDLFSGLPCPADAMTLVSCSSWFGTNLTGLTGLVFCIGFLMVSRIPYPARLRSKFTAVALPPVIVISVLLLPNHGIGLWTLLYGAVGIIQVGARWVWSQAAPADRRVPALSSAPVNAHQHANQTG